MFITSSSFLLVVALFCINLKNVESFSAVSSATTRNGRVLFAASTEGCNNNSNNNVQQDLMNACMIGFMATSAAFLAPTQACATTIQNDAFSSSSTKVVERTASSLMLSGDPIRTMDFSLPSSYDSLSDSKASATNVEGLTIEPVKLAAPAPKAKGAKADSAPKQSEPAGDGFAMSIGKAFLPSMNKGGPK